MLDELLLISGNDIPFADAGITIHQPTIEEIAYIGEQSFFTGISFLRFSKSNLAIEQQEQLEQLDDFTIFMMLLQSTDIDALVNRTAVEMVLTLMFPEYRVIIGKKEISFLSEEEGEVRTLRQEHFEEFKNIVYQMYAMEHTQGAQRDYDPKDELAKQIANKIQRGRERLNQLKAQEHNGQTPSILSRYISILAVGEQKDINILKKYTVYQLFDEFQRFNLKQSFDWDMRARMAGATNLDEIEDWMKDIHSTSDNDNF